MPTPMHPLERIPPHRRQRRCTRSSAYPQLAGTQDHRAGMVLLRAQRHMRRCRYPRSSPRRGTHATPLPLCRIPHVATTTRGGLDTRVQCICLVQGSHPLFGRPFSRTSFSRTHTHAARARTHARARTTDDERRDVRSAGVADWATARGGDIRSVRSPPRRAPLLATPIATPLQGGRPERLGLLFLKLLERMSALTIDAAGET